MPMRIRAYFHNQPTKMQPTHAWARFGLGVIFDQPASIFYLQTSVKRVGVCVHVWLWWLWDNLCVCLCGRNEYQMILHERK